MRRLIVTLDEDLDPWLSKQRNQADVVRKALKLYQSDTTTETLEGMRKSYSLIIKMLKELDSKLDFIAGKVQ